MALRGGGVGLEFGEFDCILLGVFHVERLGREACLGGAGFEGAGSTWNTAGMGEWTRCRPRLAGPTVRCSTRNVMSECGHFLATSDRAPRSRAASVGRACWLPAFHVEHEGLQRRLNLGEGRGEVRDEVVDVFEADGNAQEVLGSLGVGAFDAGSVLDEAVGAAEGCSASEYRNAGGDG